MGQDDNYNKELRDIRKLGVKPNVDFLLIVIKHKTEKIIQQGVEITELQEKVEIAKTTIQRLLDHIAENERYEMDLQRERWETELIEGG